MAGWFGLSMWGGLSVGPLIAVLMNHVGRSTAVWWTIVVLPLLSACLVASTHAQPRPALRTSLRPAAWRDAVPQGVSLPGLILGLAAYGYGTLSALLVLYLTRDHIGGQNVGLVVFAAAFLATRGAGSPLTDRFGGVRVCRVILVVEAAGLCLPAVLTSEPGALLGAAVTGIGLGLVYPSTSAITLGRAGRRQAGASMGTMTSFWDLGIMAAGPISGLVATYFGYRPAFAVAAGVTVVALVLTYLALRESPTAGEELMEPAAQGVS